VAVQGSGLHGVYRAKEGSRGGVVSTLVSVLERIPASTVGTTCVAHRSNFRGLVANYPRVCLACVCGFGWHRCHLNVLFAPEPKTLLHAQLWFLNSNICISSRWGIHRNHSDSRSPPHLVASCYQFRHLASCFSKGCLLAK
jgi:hypothetical protein